MEQISLLPQTDEERRIVTELLNQIRFYKETMDKYPDEYHNQYDVKCIAKTYCDDILVKIEVKT
jgi:hypothetical protein